MTASLSLPDWAEEGKTSERCRPGMAGRDTLFLSMSMSNGSGRIESDQNRAGLDSKGRPMPNGRQTRRSRPRLARGFAVLAVSLVAAITGAGCQRFPVRYAEVSPESIATPKTQVDSTLSSTSAKVEPGAPGEIIPLPAKPIPTETLPADPSAAIDPPPVIPNTPPANTTPLIDRALKRAEAVTAPVDLTPDPLAEAPVELPAQPSKTTDQDTPPKDKDKQADDVRGVVSTPRPDAAPDRAAGPEAAKAIVADKPASSGDDWRDGLNRLRGLALHRAGEPTDSAQAWAIRSRVLDWLAGEGTDASGETGRAWNSVLATLSTATGPETPDPATLGYHLHAAVEALESYAPIEITALTFCKKIDGFGHYEPIDAPTVRPGQPMLVYCEMSGLKYEPDHDGYRSRLSSRLELIPAEGGDVVWSEELGTAEDACRRRRRDYFVNYRIVIPTKLSPGSYSLRLTQTDLVANRLVAASLPFVVKP